MLRIKLAKSIIGEVPKNVKCVKSLGLNKVSSFVDRRDTPAIRGVIHQIKHLVTVEEVEGEPVSKGKNAKAYAAKAKGEVVAAPAPKKAAAPKAEATTPKPAAEKKAPAKKPAVKKENA